MIIKKHFEPKLILPKLISFFKWIGILGLISFIVIVLATIISIASSDSQSFSLCFNNECINNTVDAFSGAIKFMAGLIFLLTSIATIGGIFIALMGYINNHETSALNNHISHFSIFKDYIISEVSKRDRLDNSALDVFKWYNLIFSNSRAGSMAISLEYINEINNVNSVINVSNEQCQKAKNGSFLYRKHQYRMIDAVSKLGVDLEIYPRNDFYEVESQLLALISVINNEFCTDDNIPKLTERHYI